MDTKLEKALDSLHQRIKARNAARQQSDMLECEQVDPHTSPQVNNSTDQRGIIQAEPVGEIYKAIQPSPAPRDQHDLMAFPFFSLSKTKRTEPIIYEQGEGFE